MCLGLTGVRYLPVPIAFIPSNHIPMNTRIAFSTTLIGLAVLTLGSLFKFLHWPGANIQVLLGSMAFALGLVLLAINVARGRGFRRLVE